MGQTTAVATPLDFEERATELQVKRRVADEERAAQEQSRAEYQLLKENHRLLRQKLDSKSYVLFCALEDWSEKNGNCYHSHQKISEACHLSTASIKRALVELSRRQLVIITERPGHSSYYTPLNLRKAQVSPAWFEDTPINEGSGIGHIELPPSSDSTTTQANLSYPLAQDELHNVTNITRQKNVSKGTKPVKANAPIRATVLSTACISLIEDITKYELQEPNNLKSNITTFTRKFSESDLSQDEFLAILYQTRIEMKATANIRKKGAWFTSQLDKNIKIAQQENFDRNHAPATSPAQPAAERTTHHEQPAPAADQPQPARPATGDSGRTEPRPALPAYAGTTEAGRPGGTPPAGAANPLSVQEQPRPDHRAERQDYLARLKQQIAEQQNYSYAGAGAS